MIVDLGSNPGLSVLYSMSRYPEALVLAIEPVPHVFERLRVVATPCVTSTLSWAVKVTRATRGAGHPHSFNAMFVGALPPAQPAVTSPSRTPISRGVLRRAS